VAYVFHVDHKDIGGEGLHEIAHTYIARIAKSHEHFGGWKQHANQGQVKQVERIFVDQGAFAQWMA